MTEQVAADPAGEAPREPASPGPTPPAEAPKGPNGGVVKKTGRLLASAVLATSELMVRTEDKVAEQWSKATGNALTFTGGFSWRKNEDGSTEVVRRWTAPMKAVKPKRRPRWVLWTLLGGAVIAGLAFAWARRAPETPASADKPEPLF